MNLTKFFLMFAYSFIGSVLGSMAENQWHFVRWIVDKAGWGA